MKERILGALFGTQILFQPIGEQGPTTITGPSGSHIPRSIPSHLTPISASNGSIVHLPFRRRSVKKKNYQKKILFLKTLKCPLPCVMGEHSNVKITLPCSPIIQGRRHFSVSRNIVFF